MQKFLGKKLLFVVAHPDDESFAASGTIFKNHSLGGKNYIICATFGEKGKSHLDRLITQKELGNIRRRELVAASRFLKVDGLFFLKLPDANLNAKTKDLHNKVERLVEKIKPDYVFSFGRDGISGHLDHITAGKVAKAVAKKFKVPFVAFAMPPTFMARIQQIKARRKHGKYIDRIKYVAPNIKIRINLRKKLRTLQFHKSQFDQSSSVANLSKVFKEMLRYEYFLM